MLKFRSPSGVFTGGMCEYSISQSFDNHDIKGTLYNPSAALRKMAIGWQVVVGGITYHIYKATPKDAGKKVQIEFQGMSDFYYKFKKSTIRKMLTGDVEDDDGNVSPPKSLMFYLDGVFSGSGYSYTVSGSFGSKFIENFGSDTRLSLFNSIIAEWELEYTINYSSKLVTIQKRIGRDWSGSVAKKGLNLNDLALETDSSEFITVLYGYGQWNDEEDHEKGRIQAEYKSALYDTYGHLEGEPIDDESLDASELEKALGDKVEGSYATSVQLDFRDLQRMGYGYSLAAIGDNIRVINSNLQVVDNYRLVSVTREYDVKDRLMKTTVECGNISMTNKRRRALVQAMKPFTNALNSMNPRDYKNAAANAFNKIPKSLKNLDKKLEALESGSGGPGGESGDWATKAWVLQQLAAVCGDIDQMMRNIAGS